MTTTADDGFDVFLDRIVGIPSNPTVEDVVQALTLYRKSMPRKIRPGGFAEMKAIRDQRLKPAVRIVVTDDFELAGVLRDRGDAFPILIRGFNAYDFAPLYGLDVLYLMPDFGLWAVEVAHQIADVAPKTFALHWPGCNEEEILWN